jgi:hypothetical protein
MDGVTSALITVVAALSGMRDADRVLPNATRYPQAQVYPWSGTWESEDASYKIGQHVWRVEIFIGVLPDVDARLKAACGYVEELANDLYLNPTLSGACTSIRGIRWRWVEAEMAGKRELILQFDIEVKYRSANA